MQQQQYFLDLHSSVINEERLSEENFVISDSNKEVFLYLSKNSSEWSNNILIISGENGSGKTHLAHIWQKKNNALFLDSKIIHEQEEINKVINSNYNHFIIDDIGYIFLDKNLEQNLLCLINLLKENNKYLIITTDKNTKDFKFNLKDLNSRIELAIIIYIKEPDFDTIKQILYKELAFLQININKGLMDFILNNIDISYKILKDFISLFDKKAKQKHKINKKLVTQIFEDLHLNKK